MQVPSNQSIIPEIQFLNALDVLEDEAADVLISDNNEMYRKCLSLIIKDENIVDSHKKAMHQIFTKIDKNESAIVDSGELRILKIFSDKGIESKHLLHSAMFSNDIKIVAALLESGVDPNSLDDDNVTPLYYLFENDFPVEDSNKIAQMFLKSPNFNLITNLNTAYWKKNYEMMKFLVEQGASTDYVDEKFSFLQTSGNFYEGYSRTNPPLFEIFKIFPGSDKIEEKILTALFNMWISPINTTSQTTETLKLIANFLIDQPSFGITFPNFTTHLVKLIMANPLTIQFTEPCLDSLPWLIKGQQGKELMREAVEKNNPVVVSELVKRGFDVSEFYGSPLTVKDQTEQEIYRTRSPWQHAVMKNHFEIVEIMLNGGISVDLSNKQGKTALGVLLEIPETSKNFRCWHTHKETLNLLINRGANLECADQSDRTMLSGIINDPKVKNRPWPLTIQLLQRNAVLTQEEEWKLFEQAINDRQLSAATIISNRFLNTLKKEGKNAFNLLKDVNLLAKIINLQNQGWAQTILTEWVNAGLNLNDFVTIEQMASFSKGTSLLSFVIAKKKNYSIAALLISLGADIDQADDKGLTPRSILASQNIDPADLIIYAEALKHGSIAKQELRRELFIRNLGHLLADDFLQKMTNAIGDKLEGNTSSSSLAFMQKILKYILERHGTKFHGDEINKINALISQMQLAQDLAVQIEDIPPLGHESPFLTMALQNLANTAKMHLEQLPNDEMLWIPYGWSGNPSGHATMIGCQKTEEGWRFMVVNTGGGLQFHERKHDNLRLHVDTVRAFKIPQSVIDDGVLLQQIFEPLVLGNFSQETTNRIYNANDIYAIFQSFAVGPSKEIPSAWMEEQLSGTCSFRCLLAMTMISIGRDAYKVLSPLAKREVTEIGFEQNLGLIKSDPALAKLFSETIPRLFGHVSKNIKTKNASMGIEFLHKQRRRLDKLERLQQALQTSLPPQKSEISILQYNPNIPTATEDIKKSMENSIIPASSSISRGEKTQLTPLPLITPKTIKNGRHLIDAVTNFNAYLQSLPKIDGETEIVISQFLITLSQTLIDKNGLPKSALHDDLKNNPEVCLSTIKLLKEITDIHFNIKSNQFDDGTKRLAYCSALAVGWLLGQIIDDHKEYSDEGKLSHYSLPISLLSPFINHDLPLLIEPEAIGVVNRLYKYFTGNTNDRNAEIFTFYHGFHSKLTGDRHWNLTRNSTEYAYAKAHVHDMSEGKKEIASLRYAAEMEKYHNFKTDFEENEWLANFCYASDLLPEHFLVLRKLALMADLESPFNVAWNKTADNINFNNGVFLTPPDGSEYLSITHIVGPAEYMKSKAVKLSDQFLPKKTDKASFAAKSTSLINYACLRPLPQNSIITKSDLRFHGLLSVLSPNQKKTNLNVSIAMTMLLDYFNMNMNELTKQDARIVFALMTGQSKRLNAFKLKPELADEFLTFFEYAIDHFKTQVQGDIQKEGSIQALLFLMEQKQRILRQIQFQGIKSTRFNSDSLEAARREIREWRDSPELRNPVSQQHLCMVLLDSYQGKQKLDPDQVKEIIILRAELTCLLQSLPDPPSVFPHLHKSAERATLKHQSEIQGYLDDNREERNELCSHVLNIFGLKNCTGQWEEATFPLYELSFNESTYQVNVLSGNVLINGQSLGALAAIKDSPLFKELFAEKQLIGTQQEGFIDSQDNFGAIRFYTDQSNKKGKVQLESIHRQIDGEWYKFIPGSFTNKPLLPPLPNRDNLYIFQKAGSDKPEFLIVDKNTLSPKYHLDAEGYFTFPVGSNAKRYECCKIGNTIETTGLINFDPDAIMWKPAASANDDQHPPLLLFPHYNDEQGNLMAFTFVNDKWTWQASKQWHIADKQVIQGIHGLKRFLVLENTEGEKEVIIPKQTLTQLNTLESFASTCEELKLEDGKPASRSPTKNAYLAYLALAHAITPADYAGAMDYLKNAFRFEAYSGEDLRIMGWIFNLTSEKPDHIGSMDAVRLYAAWLVQDNLKRNPSKTEKFHIDKTPENKQKKPALDAHESEWKEYWNDEWTWKSKKNREMTLSLNSQLTKLSSHYLARRKTVGHSVKLENILDAQELLNWGMATRTQALRDDNKIARMSRPEAKILDLCTLQGSNPRSNNRYQIMETPETPQVFYTRPGMNFVKSFRSLYQAAKSTDPIKRQKIQQIINGMVNDSTRNNSGLRAIIQAALVLSNGHNPAAQQVIFAVDKIHEQGFRTNDERRLIQDLNNKLKAFVDSNPFDIFPAKIKPKKIPLKDIIPPHTTHTLPLTLPEQEKMSFKPSVGIAELDTLYHEYFDLSQTPLAIDQQDGFHLKTDDPFIEESIKELNRDLIKGTESNQAIPKHEIKNKNILTAMVNTLDFELEILQKTQAGLLNTRHKEMLDLARKPSEDLEKQLLKEAAILSGQKAPLSENDCIALFLLGDPEEFRRLTNLTSKNDIQTLYQAIGDYLLLSHKVGHIENIQKDVAKISNLLKIETSSEIEQAALLQKIGEGLGASEQIDFFNDPAAFIVLEQGLNLYMKKDQVEGLREMLMKDGNDPTRFRSILLQRIQGGGKTLIFGPTIALLKADGYHLSIHVPSTAQYTTALYDMQHISGKIFGQKERTLEFDDDPQRYTVEYLSWMKDTMTSAVVNREYITMTNETLRAMRCKYIKERLIIKGMLAKSNGIETPEIAEIEQKNFILKEILKMMRERGVFTFDEVHLATNPTKELNMPFGSCTSILGSEAKLIGKLLQISATLKNKNGLLLKLCENQQSQQNEEEYAEMLKGTAKKLIRDPWMQTHLKLLKMELNKTEHAELEQYFQGTREDIPAFIDSALAASTELLDKDSASLELKTKYDSLKAAADLIILAKQMLAGQWLKKRLEKSVDVHQGFSSIEQGPRVAIPYIANNVAAEGSEYSDRYVMMTNTLMTYAVKGLSPAQTVDFINQLRKAAYMERISQQEENPQFMLKDTAAAKKFSAVCKRDLFLVDIENDDTIESIRETLLAGTEESLEAIFEYAIANELPKVEIYDSQVCTHGQNTASMAQSIIGYSGSLDNPKMAPPGTVIQPEPGTNGKTIDLFLRQNDEVWIINPSKVNQETDSIFTDLIAKHPEKQRIRSIIDVGSHFKGISNDTVAEMTCKFLHVENSAIQGVLSFDAHSGKLIFRHKNQPGHALALSGTRPDIIKKETGYNPDQLFTYYDQDHITGVDISQGIDTIAVITWSEHTKIHESLQGGRRLRELNLAQRLISSIEPGAVGKIDAKLNRRHTELPIGMVPREKLGIKELVLFGHLNEAEAQREENLLFCLQKMENVLQQYVLGKAFEGNIDDERQHFDHAAHLFSKDLATDLYFEFAFKRKTIDMETFLLRTEDQLLKPLKMISTTDFQELEVKISTIIKEALDTLKPSMEISPLSKETSRVSASSLNSDATMIQFREQNKDQAKDTEKAKHQENKAVQEKLSEIDLNVFKTHKTAAEISFPKKTLENISFGNQIQIYNGINPCISELPQTIISDEEYYANLEKNIISKEPAAAEVWSLSQVISKDLGEEYQDLLDDHLLVSSNFAVSWAKRVDLTGGFRKDSFQWLMICDDLDDRKDWKLMLISIQDALDFHIMLDKAVKNNTLPNERKIILVRPGDNIKYLRQDESFDLSELESDPQASKLMAQALFFGGRLQTLNRKKWISSLDEALPKGDMRKQHSKFFEEKIIRTTSEEYASSEVYKVLNS